MLHELLATGAAAHPDRALVVGPDRTATWGEVAERSGAVAADLAARSITRFALLVDDVAELLAILAASSAVGCEACMYARTTDAAGAATLAAHFGHTVLLTDHDLPDAVDGVEVVATGTLGAPAADTRPAPASSPVLILTTGTTGMPKGARHDWSRLVATHRRRPGPADARWLLGHLPNQFAGISVLTLVLASGSTMVVPSAFQPREALEAMRTHGVTHASATPTFWRFVVALLGTDEPGALPLRQLTLTGEATPAPLLEKLHALFPDARISQIYGATEFGSSVAVREAVNGMPASVLERGDDEDVQFRIVDGELQVRSRIGMLGYYGEPDVGDSWRRTGDVVEVRGDRIHFAGRATEIINVGGVKVHPLPIEELALAVPGVHLVHAFGRANPMTGQIVQLDVVPEAGADEDALEDAIREACASLPDAAQPRRIRFVEELGIRDTKVVRGPKGDSN